MTVLDRFSSMYADICQITLEDLASIYAVNVTFIDPITTHHGLGDVQHYFSHLLEQAERCEFDIAMIAPVESNSITHLVNWTMTLKLKQSDKLITLDGNTQLTVQDDMIVYHKDYYDLGEMVYEHIPLLGFFVKKIKKRLAK
ncbi:nuclear transport factor 2 family protein [Alteromonas sp. 1_MG-2023]|uniref:nuclear transport factor 2 family protein n=1 Tax=Alteromonas sp. 1_MG-2023 TaxID=3062669 RepID=UPI0026E3D14E|nr:nuclear transport factor 2 family protein [Alteromonas sp. 1_MG-2023]MDO6566154.1 nuclear transport factor 2 family protein [Alteromonas sp. 1_MG-2023]